MLCIAEYKMDHFLMLVSHYINIPLVAINKTSYKWKIITSLCVFFLYDITLNGHHKCSLALLAACLPAVVTTDNVNSSTISTIMWPVYLLSYDFEILAACVYANTQSAKR